MGHAAFVMTAFVVTTCLGLMITLIPTYLVFTLLNNVLPALLH